MLAKGEGGFIFKSTLVPLFPDDPENGIGVEAKQDLKDVNC